MIARLAEAAREALTPELGSAIAAHVSNNGIYAIDEDAPCPSDAREGFLSQLQKLSGFPNVIHPSAEECARLADIGAQAVEAALRG